MSVYDFNVKKADGSTVSLREYEGKVLLVVNTASYCGYTKQLMGLERDYKELRDKGYEILAFPSNQFKQETDDIGVIVKNYKEKYEVSFSIFDKVMVNGSDADPFFTYLKEKLQFDPDTKVPMVMRPYYKKFDPDYANNSDVKWNFTKFLIDRKGNPVKRFEPEESPSSLVDEIKAIL